MKTGEAKVKDDVKKYLTSIGAYFFMPVQTGYGQPTLDFLVCYRGLFYAIETKKPGVKDPSPRQRLIMRQINRAGGTTMVIDSVETLKNSWWFHKHDVA